MKLLYITFVDYGEMTSGSSVRPYMMYNAFKQTGNQIKLLEGQQNKRKERKKKVQEIIDWLDDNTPDLCYIEPPTGPFFNIIDLKLLKKLNKMDIPIGLFYRDIFWKHPEHWGVHGLKQKVLVYMHERDLKVFKKVCKKIYFNTNTVDNILDIPTEILDYLPSGGSDFQIEEQNFDKKTYIYIGGTSESYGGLKLIEAFKLLNKETTKANLIFVTPENDDINWNDLNYDWLKIKHTFDREEITMLYKEATYAMIPFKKEPYMDIAAPIKLYEYLGFGIPVLSTNCNAISKILRENNCGLVCEDSINGIVNLVNESLTNEKKYNELKQGAIKFSKNNRWIDRAEKVIKDLTVKEKE